MIYNPRVATISYLANIRLPTEKAHGAQIMKTCEAFARAGAEVELVVTNRKSEGADPFAYYGVKPVFKITRLPVIDTVVLGPLGFMIETASFGISSFFYFFFHRPGVVYSRDEVPLWVVSLFLKRCIWESHTGKYNFFAKRFLSAGKKAVTISQGLKDFYRSKGAQADILVAHDAIDLEAFANPEPREAARARLGFPLDKKIVMYIGRLDGWKGTKTLFDAAKLLPEDCKVAIIGGDDAQIEKLRQTHPRVLFLGPRPYRELADNQAAADILVLPNTAQDVVSARYTSPMKLFSYMAGGKAIVSSDLPSAREIINEQSAEFFKADDAQSLADAIKRLLGDPQRAEALSHASRALASRYTWDARAQAILQFIRA